MLARTRSFATSVVTGASECRLNRQSWPTHSPMTMFSWVPALFRTSAWSTGLQVLGPISRHSGSMPTSRLSTIPALHPMPNTSKPLDLSIDASVLVSLSSPTHVAIPILV